MGTFQIKNGVLISYKGEEEIVNIPHGVKVIGEEAFTQCENLKTIQLPHNNIIRKNW